MSDPWITTVLLLGGHPPLARFVLPKVLPKGVSRLLPRSVNVFVESKIGCPLVPFYVFLLIILSFLWLKFLNSECYHFNPDSLKKKESFGDALPTK